MALTVERMQRHSKVSKEQPIKILLNDEPMAVSQGTPADIRELAIGFLLSEGILSDRSKLIGITEDANNAWVNVLSDEVPRGISRVGSTQTHDVLYRVTSAGCAQSALLNDARAMSATGDSTTGPNATITPHVTPQLAPHTTPQLAPYSESCATFKAEDIAAMMEQLCQKSPRRNNGECVHGCGIGNGGELVLVREDIGRHNAMDKLIGQAWLDGIPMHKMAMFSTGRISYEMAIKAAHAGVSVLVSHKSVTDAALDFAEDIGLTLVGTCRADSMQILTCHNRIL